MKHKTNFRSVLAILTIAIGLLFLESKRIQNKRTPNKATKKVSREANGLNVSNTDYIFFESLSKYMFISL